MLASVFIISLFAIALAMLMGIYNGFAIYWKFSTGIPSDQFRSRWKSVQAITVTFIGLAFIIPVLLLATDLKFISFLAETVRLLLILLAIRWIVFDIAVNLTMNQPWYFKGSTSRIEKFFKMGWFHFIILKALILIALFVSYLIF